ncbi:DddA-like double-stranded DNA deaminase toxin [Streptoalloteichus hindustanus]|uniref:SCP1.201-like deaminase n=1 Tax=Streptoalloteichus hindustanus TaxID=2017 RepID=A0A1M5MJH9_STRHI|nr:DddA-like double-stranded DNA deaminase toxin [Streptoalloteichus hindustanus]SHG77365.1 SCP1.201-like deaminase [Streptoalloteichus hindustanus]
MIISPIGSVLSPLAATLLVAKAGLVMKEGAVSALAEVAQAVRSVADQLPSQEIVVAESCLRECQTAVVAATEGSWSDEPVQIVAMLASTNDRLDELRLLLAELTKRLHDFADRLASDGSPTGRPAPDSAAAPAQRPFPVDRGWGQRARARLPVRPGGKGPTTGVYVDEDGIEHTVRSGAQEDGLDEELKRFMVEASLVPTKYTNLETSKHVEVMVAYRMRLSGTDRAELAINNRIDRMKYGCRRLLPGVLAPGQMLVIHDDDGTHIFKGKDTSQG